VSDESPANPPENPYSTLLAILGGGVALALIIFAIGFATRDSGGGGESGGGGGSVPITLTEFKIEGNLSVPAGSTLAVTNEGTQVHNLVIDGDGKTADLQGGQSEDLVVNVDPGEYEVYCSISGHKEAGMVGTMTVTAGGEGEMAAPAADSGGGNEHGGTGELDYETLTNQMNDSFMPFVDQVTTGQLNTEGLGGQDLEPTVTIENGQRVLSWDITMEIVDWEITPGKTVKAWTYNGTVPGPTLRGEVGDRIRVKFTNKLPMASDVHMHGMVLPNDQDGVAPLTQPLIMPGEEYTYEYVVEKPAVAMYHPHHHGQMQVPNGMWGAMIFSPPGGGGTGEYQIPRGRTISGVNIPADVKPVMEKNMVLNDAGVIGLSLNGKGFPATEPYNMKVGDWALFHYFNEGYQVHPMHLHQFPQLVIGRDGIPLESPYWADTLTIAPGERFSVLFQVDKPGVWVWHCHILNHAESETGMIGMVTAIAVSDPNAAA
jgi:FtsP/CotA-like multicopper oxidase with cupredoxin domain